MRVVDRHRIKQLIALSALERTLKGPERLLREEDVAILIKAAYDDATPEARAAFMDRVKKYPDSDWPWSAVAAGAVTRGGGGGIGNVIVVAPAGPKTPAALILLLGQVEAPDLDPGDRLPPSGSPEAAPWAPLFKALAAWDTATIAKYITPGGWMTPNGAVPVGELEGDEGMSEAPPDDGGRAPGPNAGSGKDGKDGANGQGESGGPPATRTPPPSVPNWVWGLAIAGSTALVVGAGVYLLRREPAPPARTLEDELRRQGGGR